MHSAWIRKATCNSYWAALFWPTLHGACLHQPTAVTLATSCIREQQQVKLARRPHCIHVMTYGEAPWKLGAAKSSCCCCTLRLHTSCFTPVLHQPNPAEVLPAKSAACLQACEQSAAFYNLTVSSTTCRSPGCGKGPSVAVDHAHHSTDQPHDFQTRPLCVLSYC
jgi:hypothetical protein